MASSDRTTVPSFLRRAQDEEGYVDHIFELLDSRSRSYAKVMGSARSWQREYNRCPTDELEGLMQTLKHMPLQGPSEISPDLLDTAQSARPYFSALDAVSRVNEGKNRYNNVIPYDVNRVRLPPIGQVSVGGQGSSDQGSTSSSTKGHRPTEEEDWEQDSDYINASWIRCRPHLPISDGGGEGIQMKARWYIAAQAPLPETVAAFWRMIAVERVKVIVMVTQCHEGGRVKSHDYMLRNTGPQGRYIVNICSEREAGWRERIEVSKLGEVLVTEGAETSVQKLQLVWSTYQNDRLVSQDHRIVTHLQYSTWPDHGVPDLEEPIVKLIRLADEENSDDGTVQGSTGDSPIVVHCSAGVGRTGTYIVLSELMRAFPIYLSGSVDKAGDSVVLDDDVDVIPPILDSLRQKRMAMIQNVGQLDFCYRAAAIAWRDMQSK